jgi:hypothetical protein
MERALTKAAQVNSNVGMVFDEAVNRLPTRLFVHVTSDPQRGCFYQLLASLKDGDEAAITVPSIARVQWDGKVNEIRALKDDDVPRAQDIANIFGGLGFPVKVVNLTNVWSGAKKVRPNTLELWFGNTELPPLCTSKGAMISPPAKPNG